MILWLGIGAGLIVGLGLSRLRGHPYSPPVLKHVWIVFVGFLPQLFTIYLGDTRTMLSDPLVAWSIAVSQISLLIFALLNRHLPGMTVLIIGLVLNLIVMLANGGFMPINPNTAKRVVGAEGISAFEIGDRIGYKDILLPATTTRLEWLADRFLPPAKFPYQVAFSLGDIFIGFGTFWLLAYQKKIT